MHDHQDACQVNQPVQAFPVLAHALHPPFERGKRQEGENQQRPRPHQDVASLGDLAQDQFQIETEIQTSKEREVRSGK